MDTLINPKTTKKNLDKFIPRLLVTKAAFKEDVIIESLTDEEIEELKSELKKKER